MHYIEVDTQTLSRNGTWQFMQKYAGEMTMPLGRGAESLFVLLTQKLRAGKVIYLSVDLRRWSLSDCDTNKKAELIRYKKAKSLKTLTVSRSPTQLFALLP